MEKQSVKIVSTNREARHEYFVEEEFEAGIELVGTEVKSIRAGTMNLKDAWCGIKNGELLINQTLHRPEQGFELCARFHIDQRDHF